MSDTYLAVGWPAGDRHSPRQAAGERRCGVTGVRGRQYATEPRRRCASAEPGMVTAEWATSAPAIAAALILALTGLSAALGMVSANNAAREAARTYAISADPAAATQLARDISGPAAKVEIQPGGELITVKVRQPAPGVLGKLGITLTGRHRAVLEPGSAPPNR